MEYERKTPRQTPIMSRAILLLIPVIIAICSMAGYKIYKYYNYTGELVGIIGSKVYHRDNCQFVKKAGANTIVLFKDKMKAAEAGFRACNTCSAPDNSLEIAIVQDRANKLKAEQAKQEKIAGDLIIETRKEQAKKTAEIKKSDINKYEILGSSVEKHPYYWTITGTIKNNNSQDTTTEPITVKAIFYDKNKKPIATSETSCMSGPGEINGFTISQFENIKNLSSYELTLIR